MSTGEFNAGGNPAILGFHVTSEKTKIELKLKILKFLPLSGKSHF